MQVFKFYLLKNSEFFYNIVTGHQYLKNSKEKQKIFLIKKNPKSLVYNRYCIGQNHFWPQNEFCGKYLKTKYRNRNDKWFLLSYYLHTKPNNNNKKKLFLKDVKSTAET